MSTTMVIEAETEKEAHAIAQAVQHIQECFKKKPDFWKAGEGQPVATVRSAILQGVRDGAIVLMLNSLNVAQARAIIAEMITGLALLTFEEGDDCPCETCKFKRALKKAGGDMIEVTPEQALAAINQDYGPGDLVKVMFGEAKGKQGRLITVKTTAEARTLTLSVSGFYDLVEVNSLHVVLVERRKA